MTWLTVTLGALTAGALFRFFWQANAGPVSVRQALVAGALVVSFLASIRVTPMAWGTPQLASGARSPSTSTATTVPVSVQGATLTREEAVRLDSCEAALAAIADAVARAAEAGSTVAPAESGAAATADPERRLTSCEVRLKAIASTLPAGAAGG